MKVLLLVTIFAVQDKRTVEVNNDVKLEVRVTDSVGTNIKDVSQNESGKYSEVKSDRCIVTVLEHSDKTNNGKLFLIHKDKVIGEDGKESELKIGSWLELDKIASALKVIEVKKGEEWEMALGENTKLLGLDIRDMPNIECKIEEVTDKTANISLYFSSSAVTFSGTLEVSKKDYKPISYQSIIDFEIQQILTDKQYDVNKRQLVDKEIGRIVIKTKTFKTNIKFSPH